MHTTSGAVLFATLLALTSAKPHAHVVRSAADNQPSINPGRLRDGWGADGYRCDNGYLGWSQHACQMGCGGVNPNEPETHSGMNDRRRHAATGTIPWPAPGQPTGSCSQLTLMPPAPSGGFPAANGKCEIPKDAPAHPAFISNKHNPTTISGVLVDVIQTQAVAATANPWVCGNCPITQAGTSTISKPSGDLRPTGGVARRH
ncbi:MAG: hypothetical protein Q9227_001642 [Pyrenula ochraceoflavens]